MKENHTTLTHEKIIMRDYIGFGLFFFFLASMGNLCSAYTGAFIAKVKQKSKY